MKLIDLTVQNVRGLRHLQLRMDGKNVVISGPNGAGKSCVVDAIDFLFTGRISRLTGEGTKGITLSEHGPHIDHQSETARVTATVLLPGIPAPVQVERCIADPDRLICAESARAPLAKVTALMRKGGVILTRRDILRYVTAEAAKRADEIELLLDLKEVDSVRSGLQRARTELTRNETTAGQAIGTAQADVNVTLRLAKYSDAGLLEAVNECRQALGGAPLDLGKSNRFKEGISPQTAFENAAGGVNPVLIRGTTQNIKQAVVADLASADEQLKKEVAELQANQDLLAQLERLELTEHAARFVDDSTIECPICGAQWPAGHINNHLGVKLAAARSAELTRDSIHRSAEIIATPAQGLRANVKALSDGLRAAQAESEDQDVAVMDMWGASLDGLLVALANPVDRYLDNTLVGPRVGSLFAPESLDGLLDRIEKTVEQAVTEPTPEQTAWDKLTRLEESARALESRISEKETVNLRAKRSNVLLAEFDKARDFILGSLYSRIADRFVEYYGMLHDHESDHFAASLQPQRSSLTFEVDFLGRGNHPPHALHSEGHQDSMGVCLFLALNEELAQGTPSLIVLDDVVMSVDSGHKKEICNLIPNPPKESSHWAW